MMRNTGDIPFENRLGHKDLYPLFYGSEKCLPGKAFGPAVRSHYIIHYVVEGCGVLYAGGKEYPVKAGEIFIIYPNAVSRYIADKDDPWQYIWLGFDGLLAPRFYTLPTPVTPVSHVDFRAMLCELEESQMPELPAIAYLHTLFAEIFDRASKTDYVTKVENEIEAGYYREISVESLAAACSIDRRYLSRLFRERKGVTLGQYIIDVRMEKAKHLLAAGTPVLKTSELVGYPDYTVFSKIFRKKVGMPPREYIRKFCKKI